jgi:hypothetical protein
MKKTSKDCDTKKTFLNSIISGIGWAFGASIGFALLVTFFSYVLKLLGGLPLVGKFFGQITEHALNYLQTVK